MEENKTNFQKQSESLIQFFWANRKPILLFTGKVLNDSEILVSSPLTSGTIWVSDEGNRINLPA